MWQTLKIDNALLSPHIDIFFDLYNCRVWTVTLILQVRHGLRKTRGKCHFKYNNSLETEWIFEGRGHASTAQRKCSQSVLTMS